MAKTPLDSAPRWISTIAAAAAVAVAVGSARGAGRDLDGRLHRALNRDRGRLVDRFFKGTTELGSIWASASAAVALARLGRPKEGADALGAAAAMWALGQLLKRVFLRPRPYDALPNLRLMIERPRGTSWPSSHPAVLLAFASVAARDLDAADSLRGGLVGLAVTVGLSRIYLGVHYPADVVGGLLLGRVVADVWSAAVSPRVLGRPPSVGVPATVSG